MPCETVKHFYLAVKRMGDFSSCKEQKASMIHRWFDELQGIRMAKKRKENQHTIPQMLTESHT